MKKISVVGIDLAKNVFQVFGVDKRGVKVVSRKLSRTGVRKFFALLEPCIVAMEACSGSHYWARTLTGMGHTVKMMNPKFVKPYLKGNKNDYNDAEAITEAAQRPNMRFVEPLSIDQQSVLHLHRSRRLMLKERVALSNHIRALLVEMGIVIAKGIAPFERNVPILLTEEDSCLPPFSRQSLLLMWEQYCRQQALIKELDRQLSIWHKGNKLSSRVAQIPGVGLQTATALVAKLGNAKNFRNGREVAAYIGLVPKQASSGGRERLLGISKRGDGELRRLLVQGAKSVIRHVKRRLSAGLPGGYPWIENLLARKHPNIVAIALANKMARVAWVVLAKEEDYCSQYTK